MKTKNEIRLIKLLISIFIIIIGVFVVNGEDIPPGHPIQCYNISTDTGWISEGFSCYYGAVSLGFKETCIKHPSYPDECGTYLACNPPCKDSPPQN